MVVSGLSALTGGRASQFVLFFAWCVIPVVCSAGLPAGSSRRSALARVLGAALDGQRPGRPPATFETAAAVAPAAASPSSGRGFLAGVLGERVRRTREDLERTTRELDRVRVDNDADPAAPHAPACLTVDGASGSSPI